MYSLRGQKFSTIDRDNDNWLEEHCAKRRGGGWWHNRCGASSLNGQYFPYEESNNTSNGGIRWNMINIYLKAKVSQLLLKCYFLLFEPKFYSMIL